MSDHVQHLRTSPIWQEACSLAEFMYGQIDEHFSDLPDEKWNTESKLRNAANDMLFSISQALGSVMLDAREYDLNAARKNLFSMQAMYIFAGKQKFLKIDPDVVIRIDKLLATLDAEIAVSQSAGKEVSKKDMEPWLEKYRLWKAMQERQ